jgi:hypothetical protein
VAVLQIETETVIWPPLQQREVPFKELSLEAERFCPQCVCSADEIMRLFAGPLQVMKDF